MFYVTVTEGARFIGACFLRAPDSRSALHKAISNGLFAGGKAYVAQVPREQLKQAIECEGKLLDEATVVRLFGRTGFELQTQHREQMLADADSLIAMIRDGKTREDVADYLEHLERSIRGYPKQ